MHLVWGGRACRLAACSRRTGIEESQSRTHLILCPSLQELRWRGLHLRRRRRDRRPAEVTGVSVELEGILQAKRRVLLVFCWLSLRNGARELCACRRVRRDVSRAISEQRHRRWQNRSVLRDRFRSPLNLRSRRVVRQFYFFAASC